MTRVTNFGRKRTYLQAGFGTSEELPQKPEDQNVAITNRAHEGAIVGGERASADVDGEPPKKKRKRIRKKKPRADTEASTGKEGDDEGVAAEGAISQSQDDKDGKGGNGPSNKALKKKKWKEKEKEKKQRRLLSSEMRRQKRIQRHLVDTTCFACREKGHAAKDCPKVKSEAGSDDTKTKAKTKGVMGICYRCGSTRHTLAKCNKAVDESNPLPFASCFVCNGNGHLASSCPQNTDKGIYPNGGCCKLCGEKTHLAKDCELRKKDNIDALAVMGTGGQAGADEDDFHTFKRRKQEVEKEAKTGDTKKTVQTKSGPHSGLLKPFGATQKPVKKVVYF